MSTNENSNTMLEQRATLRQALAAIGDFRPGTLQQRYRKCGKPTCHCAREGDPGHGPKWVLTRTVDGKRRNFSIPDAAVEETRAQVAEFQRFRQLTRELIEFSEGLCHARLTADRSAAQEAKKGASRPASRRR